MDWSSGICLFNKDPRWSLRLPRWHGSKESACHCRRCRRHGFSPWVGRSSEGEMATHSSILAWKIPWTEEPGGLQSMRSQTAGHNWVTEHTHTPGDLHACGLWTTLFKTILTSKPPIPCNHLDFCSISSQPTSYVFADLYSNSYRDSVQQSKADFSLKSKSVTVSELPGLLDKPLTKMHINDITLTNAEPGMGGVLCHGDSPSPLTVNYLGK